MGGDRLAWKTQKGGSLKKEREIPWAGAGEKGQWGPRAVGRQSSLREKWVHDVSVDIECKDLPRIPCPTPGVETAQADLKAPHRWNDGTLGRGGGAD